MKAGTVAMHTNARFTAITISCYPGGKTEVRRGRGGWGGGGGVKMGGRESAQQLDP